MNMMLILLSSAFVNCLTRYTRVWVLVALLPTVAGGQPVARSLRPKAYAFPAGSRSHHSFANSDDQSAPNVMAVGGDASSVSNWPALRMAPTRSSFLINWQEIAGAKSYHIDVSTDPNFRTHVTSYHDLDVGNVNSQIICRLKSATRYYYRVSAYNSNGVLLGSQTGSEQTSAASTGLVINPTYDSSITSRSNAAAIEASIHLAVARYQSLFSDPVTIEILFRYSTTEPDGTDIPDGVVAGSWYVVYSVPWNEFIGDLKADSKSTNDSLAYANLPTVPLSHNIVPSSANGRSIALDTPPAMFADGSVGSGGPYDGIVTLNANVPFQFTRPPSSANYDAQSSAEHEIDEIMGLGSYLGGSPENTDLRPQDLFSWSAPATRSHSATGIRYFSIDNGNTNIVNFSQDPGGDFGDWLSEPCPQTHPYVQNAFGCKGQFMNVTATSPEGINLDVVGYDLTSAILPPSPNTLGNISTRGDVQSGDQVLIGGFIITGNQPKEVILRAIGPSLPVSGVLRDPLIEVHDSSGAIIGSNDNWRASQETAIINTGVAPTNNREAAIILTLAPGSYTAIVKGASGGNGVALVEVYDLDQAATSKLANISTRGFVGTGDNVLIGGFIVLGSGSANTIVRAIGPSLTAQGVAGALQDPTLELRDHNGTLIASNDDWRSDQETQIIATGIAPTSDGESAIVQSLAPDSYTAIVRGKANATGVALVEIYQLEN